MKMIFKNKLFTAILVLALTSIICTSLVPTVQAMEPNLEAKNVAILNGVIGINTDAYSTSKITQTDTDFLGSSQKETDMQLTSAQSNLRVTCSYVKDTLKLVYLSDLEGGLSLKQPANSTVDMAKGLLERYENSSSTSIYGEFASMLNGIKVNEDVTKYGENVKLAVSGSEQNRVSYTWTYVDSNGIPAEKKNVILIYEKGTFKAFFNNWPLYNILESKSNFSTEQATELAIKASGNFSYPVTFDNGTKMMASGFSIAPESLGNAKLIYVNSVDQKLARGGDPFSMYLAWYVPLGFDRLYPGDVSGMTVILWADTGEVCSMDRVIVDSKFGNAFADQTSDTATVQQLQQSDFSTQAIGLSAVTGLIFVPLIASKKFLLTGNMKRTRKFFGTLLCALVALSMIFISLPSANAVSVTGKSRVYSCYGIQTENGYYNQTADDYEADAMAALCNFVGNASLDAGYDTSNVYSNTVNTAVVSNAGEDEQNYLGTMVFHAGHFSVENQAYQDSSGHRINASDIYPQTGLGRHFFVFLWVCVQAEDPTSGTPRAWTHRDGSTGRPNMTEVYDKELGYLGDDGKGQCYISFYGFSPMLSTYVPNSNNIYYNFADVGSPGPCYWFALKFYNYALYEGYSVRDSLDIASGEFFGCDYSSTVLNMGYHSWWPESGWPYPMNHSGYYPRDFNDELPPEDRRDPNRMRVFGDSNIQLSQPSVTFASSGLPSGVSPAFYFDGDHIGGTGTFRVVPHSFNVTVGPVTNYKFVNFYYHSNYYPNGAILPFYSDGTLTANFVPAYTLTATSAGGGSTDPSGNQQYQTGTYAQVQAYPNSGKVLAYWLEDGWRNLGNSPTQNIYMNSNHTLVAAFTDAPAYRFVSSIVSQNGYVYDSYELAGYQPDGNYATMETYGTQENIQIEGQLNAPQAGSVYVYGYSEQAHMSVYVSNNGADWTYLSTKTVSASPCWMYCGTTSIQVNYVLIVLKDQPTYVSLSVDSVRVEQAQYRDLTLSSTAGGDTDPAAGVHQYIKDSTAYVTANPAEDYIFDYWLVDDQYAGSTYTIGIVMDDNHEAHPVFHQAVSYYLLTVDAYWEGDHMVYPGVYVDDEYVGSAPFADYFAEGWHSVYVDETAYDDYSYPFHFWYFSDHWEYENPVSFNFNQDQHIVANYLPY